MPNPQNDKRDDLKVPDQLAGHTTHPDDASTAGDGVETQIEGAASAEPDSEATLDALPPSQWSTKVEAESHVSGSPPADPHDSLTVAERRLLDQASNQFRERQSDAD